jgi:hypothetical protein
VISSTNAIAILDELLDRGYRLSVTTRVEVTHHKVGTQRTTYGDRLRVEGAKPPPEELTSAIAENLDELLAATCIIEPPVPWLAELVKRCRERHTMHTHRLIPYRKREGTVALKRAAATTTITPLTLAANTASFIALDPAHDALRLEPIIREALSRMEEVQKHGFA